MTELRRVGVPFIRRRSGGGTVYHVNHSLPLLSLWCVERESLGYWKFKLLNPPFKIFVRPERFRESRIARHPVPRSRGRERE